MVQTTAYDQSAQVNRPTHCLLAMLRYLVCAMLFAVSIIDVWYTVSIIDLTSVFCSVLRGCRAQNPTRRWWKSLTDTLCVLCYLPLWLSTRPSMVCTGGGFGKH